MGTFKIKPTSLGSSTFTLVSGTTLGAFQAGALNSSVIKTNGSGALARLDCALATSIFLDNSVLPTSFSSLPAGFTVVTHNPILNGGGSTNGDNSASWFMQFDSSTESSNSQTGLFTYPNTILSMLDLVNGGFGVRGVGTGTSDALFGTLANGWFISGNYSIQNFSWTISPSTSVSPGTKVTITASSGLGLGTLSSLSIQYVDSNGNTHIDTVLAQDFLSQSQTQVVFFFPQFGNLTTGSTVYIYAIDNGTQFSGSVLAGTLTVKFADASGIYILTPFASTDIIYNAARDGTTTSVNILDPIIKTGFIP